MTNQNSKKARVYYIDNLRIFLIGLVVLHHLAITYGAPGGWFYNESQAEFPEIIVMSMFVATNQAYFMGMFFFISAYFMVPSLEKKGQKLFTKERFIRLGIPLLIFYFIIYPFTVYFRDFYIYGESVSFLDYLTTSMVWGFGPMWFVEALLIYSLFYTLIIWKKGELKEPGLSTLPAAWKIILAAVLIGLAQFIIRIWLPVGWSMPFTNFQFPHFLQYILLFSFGIIAYKQNWLDSITKRMGWKWFWFAQALIFIGFPTQSILGGADAGVEPFMGGITWQSFVYSIWEQLLGFSMILGLMGIFKSFLNNQKSIAKKLSASAYAVYIIHTPILVIISYLFLNFNIPQLWKFVALAPIALVSCFSIGYLLKQLPLAKKIL